MYRVAKLWSFLQLRLIPVVGWCIGTAISVGYGHEGPPFPIIVDEPVAGMQASVWTDPDIGEARFFLILESPSSLPMLRDVTATMRFGPTSQRVAMQSCEGTTVAQDRRIQIEFRPHFDVRDMWVTEFVILRGKQEVGHLATTVESTPPGYGPWDLGLYMIPFVLLGGLWGAAILRRQKLKHTSQVTIATATSPSPQLS